MPSRTSSQAPRPVTHRCVGALETASKTNNAEDTSKYGLGCVEGVISCYVEPQAHLFACSLRRVEIANLGQRSRQVVAVGCVGGVTLDRLECVVGVQTRNTVNKLRDTFASRDQDDITILRL